jgi:hypothetical protein
LRQTQDPLSDWNVGDDAIDQVGSAFRHPPATTTRAERAPLARERDEPIQGAPVAAKPREATSQEPAPEEVPKRALDEWRQAVTVAQPRRLGQERLEVILHDLVKDAAAGIAGFVARGRPGHPAHDAEAVPTSQPTPFGQNWRFPSSDVALLAPCETRAGRRFCNRWRLLSTIKRSLSPKSPCGSQKWGDGLSTITPYSHARPDGRAYSISSLVSAFALTRYGAIPATTQSHRG